MIEIDQARMPNEIASRRRLASQKTLPTSAPTTAPIPIDSATSRWPKWISDKTARRRHIVRKNNATGTGRKSKDRSANCRPIGGASVEQPVCIGFDMYASTANGGCGRHRPHRGLKVKSHTHCMETQELCKNSEGDPAKPDLAATTCWLA